MPLGSPRKMLASMVDLREMIPGDESGNAFPCAVQRARPSRSGCELAGSLELAERLGVSPSHLLGTGLAEYVAVHGTLGWVLDPEGNRVEPWEPPSGCVVGQEPRLLRAFDGTEDTR